MAGPVTTGSLLRSASPIFQRGCPTFMTVSLLVYSPLVLLLVIQAALGQLHPLLEPGLNLASAYLFGPLASAAVIHGVFRLRRGGTTTVAECLRVAFARPLPVIGAALLVALAAGLATLACLVPGIVVGCGLFVAIPALVVERLRVGDIVSRSWELTDGYKLSIFGVFLLLWLLGLGFGAIVGMLGANLGAPAAPNALYLFLFLLLLIFFATLQAVVAAVAYHDLRITKEGLDEEELAAVFE